MATALGAGTRLGVYEISGVLGAGGMGEVYRARDTRLNRDVALKVLPPDFAADPDRVARFQREAQVLATLNHPHVAHIYGLEESGAAPALVLELVEGPTLADRIAEGPVPIAESIRIARQIAEAVEAAHAQGIVHRDLKPSNVKIRPDGTVKVLDFGLAKALTVTTPSGSSGFNPANSPTFTSPAMTQLGLIVGTAAYMSPEQAKGKSADTRADIWAFGVVLWEMLTGHPLFAGESISETLASVIKDQPRFDLLPADTPAPVRWLLTRCLEPEPGERLRDIGEARVLLGRPTAAAPVGGTARPRSRVGQVFAVGALFAAAVTAAMVWYLRPTPPSIPLRQFELPGAVAARSFALSPDGTRIAYFDNAHLRLRALDAIEPRDLGAVHVTSDHLFWSPDSRFIGFTAENTIRTLPADGGPLFVVCKVPASGRVMDVRWMHNGRIAFSVWRDSLYTVAATGGTPAVQVAIDPKTEIDFHEVSVLPDDRLIVATHERREDRDAIELITGTSRVRLSDDPTVDTLEYVPPGFLLFHRSGPNAGVWTLPFTETQVDLSRATLVYPRADGYSVATDGTLAVAIRPASKSSLVWVDGTGGVSVVPGAPLEIQRGEIAIAPDGRRAAFVAGVRPDQELVVRDLATGTDTRLTFRTSSKTENAYAETLYPAWFPAGDRIVHIRGRIEATKAVVRRADVASEARELTGAIRAIVSHDGRMLVFVVDDRGAYHLRRAPFLPDGTLGPPQRVFTGADEPDVIDFDLSPDGRLLAYAATQADGKATVFISDFPDGGGRLLVAEGARRPRFTRDGRRIFYIQGSSDSRGQPKGTFMSATVTVDSVVKLGPAEELFDDTGADAPSINGYDIGSDGRRFLMWKRVPGEPPRAVLVQNWMAAVRR
jgi:eukaryotic-like serine/threonine-protein kinase